MSTKVAATITDSGHNRIATGSAVSTETEEKRRAPEEKTEGKTLRNRH
jgi:hypothetical protein